ncbi:MAG: hypothetical protein L3J07_02825 [Candidatus Magasanikbacteria bacterium]|nr:hypothetical protein [Candidatus Magasanikbacteria bacterium]
MVTRREEDIAFLKEILECPISKILYGHENVECEIQTEEMSIRLGTQGRVVFIREIQKIRDVLEVLIDYELFETCSEIIGLLDDKLKDICVENTEKECCVELNSVRQWMSSLQMGFTYIF